MSFFVAVVAAATLDDVVGAVVAGAASVDVAVAVVAATPAGAAAADRCLLLPLLLLLLRLVLLTLPLLLLLECFCLFIATALHGRMGQVTRVYKRMRALSSSHNGPPPAGMSLAQSINSNNQ